jgi:hypothetical protein
MTIEKAFARAAGSGRNPPKALLASFSSEEMTCRPVSTRVGNVKNNDASLIEPIAAWRRYAFGRPAPEPPCPAAPKQGLIDLDNLKGTTVADHQAATGNAAQIEFWNSAATRAWADQYARMDRGSGRLVLSRWGEKTPRISIRLAKNI